MTLRDCDALRQGNIAFIHSAPTGERAGNSMASTKLVMPGLVPGIHVLVLRGLTEDVDGRDKPGHDGEWGRTGR